MLGGTVMAPRRLGGLSRKPGGVNTSGIAHAAEAMCWLLRRLSGGCCGGYVVVAAEAMWWF